MSMLVMTLRAGPGYSLSPEQCYRRREVVSVV